MSKIEYIRSEYLKKNIKNKQYSFINASTLNMFHRKLNFQYLTLSIRVRMLKGIISFRALCVFICYLFSLR